jgi:hypothetical protein
MKSQPQRPSQLLQRLPLKTKKNPAQRITQSQAPFHLLNFGDQKLSILTNSPTEMPMMTRKLRMRMIPMT